MKGTILQPTFMPWLGYFEMIDTTDVFVIFDHVQFAKKSWQHRNRIKTANGENLLSIPTFKASRETAIKEIKIFQSNNSPLADNWKTICHNYQKAPYFSMYNEELERIYLGRYEFLIEFTVSLIRKLCNLIGIQTKFIYSSSLILNEEDLGKTQKVINLCQKAGLTYLYDAKGAKEILDIAMFAENNITIEFQNYEHPVYNQLFGEFIPYMSVIDLIFNEGPNSIKIIRKGRKTPCIK
jgi:hypothetical protein